MKTRYLAAAVLVLSTALALPASAQTASEKHPLLTDTFSASVGSFFNQKNVSIEVDGKTPGDNIDFDKVWDLGASESSISGTFRWRFGEKWSVFGQYFDTGDSARATLQEDVHWQDVVFKAGSNVGAGVDLSVARLFFGRLFSTGPKHELGLGAGIHRMKIDAFIDGEVFVNDQSNGFQRKSVDANAPLPNLGGWWYYAFSPRWMLSTRLDWLGVTIGDYSGSLWNTSAGLNFQAFKNVGLRLSYQFFRLDVDVDKDDWKGSTTLEYKGPYLAATFNW